MENLIVALCAIAATLVGVWGTVIYPRSRERRKEKAVEEKKLSEQNAFLDGVPAVAGVTEGAKTAAVRLALVETGLRGVASGQALIEQRMDEANGTGKRTEQKVDKLASQLELVLGHLGLSQAS